VNPNYHVSLCQCGAYADMRQHRCTPALTAGAVHATYAVAQWQRIDNQPHSATLYASMRAAPRRALAAPAVAAYAASRRAVPAYTIVDCGQDGAQRYASVPATRQPLYSPFGAMVLDAVRMLRRWRWHSATPAD
jgi:hypothetical protein